MSSNQAMRTLSTYLDDHRAGAAAGQQLAERLAAHHRRSGGEALRAVARQVGEDADTLESIRQALGVGGGAIKRLLALAGGLLTRWRPDRRLVHPEALALVLDLEAMIAGVDAKRQLWSVLDLMSDDPRLQAFDFSDLVVRADQQIELLRSAHRIASEHLVPSSDGR